MARFRNRAAVGEAGKSGSWHRMQGNHRNSAFALLALFLLALPAAGQLTFGEFSSNMNGVLSAGYNGTYGNQINSGHSLAFGGSGTLDGFYYSPNFVSFQVSPYLNQARDNSSYQSISNASGANFSSNIFGGSHFPGSINFAKAYDSEGNYSIPGVANYTTHGDSQTFGVNWSELVPGWPTLSAGFQMGSTQYSVYGANDNGTTDSHSFNLRSSYTLEGFKLSAFFADGAGHSDVPELLEGSTQSVTTSSSSHSYGFTVSHALPWHGGIAGSATSSEFSSEYAGGTNSGTVDTYTAAAVFQPTQKFHFSLSTDYSTNLSGSLTEAVTGAGGVTEPINVGEHTHALDLTANASYSVMSNLQALVFADHREQYYEGENFGASAFGAGMTYWRPLLGGNFNAAVNLSDNMSSTSNANSLGLNSTINFNRRFSDGWVISGGFGYSQNVQTLLITYTTSSYNYSGSVRRRFGKFGWGGGAGVNKTLVTEVAGSGNSSETFNTSIFYSHWLTANGNYSKTSGTAIQGGLGLIQNPIPPIVPGNDIILFGGKSYSFGLSTSPVRRLSIGASYSRSLSNDNLAGVISSANSKMLNATFNYQFRKMYLTGGYSNLVQGFSASGLPAANVSSFYIGVTRWFNFF